MRRDRLAHLAAVLRAYDRAFTGGPPRYGFATSMHVLRLHSAAMRAASADPYRDATQGDGGGGVGATRVRGRTRCRCCGRFLSRAAARRLAADARAAAVERVSPVAFAALPLVDDARAAAAAPTPEAHAPAI